MKHKKNLHIILVSITLMIFLIPFISSFVLKGKLGQLLSFSKATTQLQENLPFVDNLYDFYNIIKFEAFKSTTDDTVIVGKNKMLFSSETTSSSDFQDYKGKNPFSDEELTDISTNLSKLNKYFNKNDIKFTLSILPNKTSIYDDYLPKKISKEKGYTRLEQLIDSINNDTPINLIDLRSVLNSDSSDLLYNKTNGRLSDLGQFYCYEHIASKLDVNHSLKKDDLMMINGFLEDGEYSKKINLSQYLKEPIHKINENLLTKYLAEDINIYNNKDASSRNILILDDNNLEKLPMLLSNDVSDVTYSSLDIDLDYIKKEKPDNIIFQISEDNLGLLLTKLDIDLSSSNIINNTENIPVTTSPSIANPSIIAKKQISPDRLAVVVKADGATTLNLNVNGQNKKITTENGIFIGEIPITTGINNIIEFWGENSLTASNHITMTVFGEKQLDTLPLTISDDGWFFLTSNIRNFDTPILTENQLDSIKNNLIQVQQHILSANPNAKLVVSVAPNKATVYYKYKNSPIDQLSTTLKDTDIIFADNRIGLTSKNSIDELFYKTDTHWNSLGAFYGYTNLMNSIKPFSKNLNILSLDNFNIAEKTISSGDLFSYLGIGNNITKEREFTLTPTFNKMSNFIPDPPLTWVSDKNKPFTITNKNTSLPKAVLYRDSFATGMLPFISESFSRIYVNTEWDYKYNKSITESEKADFVIIQIVEKNIINLAE